MVKGQDVETPFLAIANSDACCRSWPCCVSAGAVLGSMGTCVILHLSSPFFWFVARAHSVTPSAYDGHTRQKMALSLLHFQTSIAADLIW